MKKIPLILLACALSLLTVKIICHKNENNPPVNKKGLSVPASPIIKEKIPNPPITRTPLSPKLTLKGGRLKLGGPLTIIMVAPGEYTQPMIRSDGQGGTQTNTLGLMANGGVGTQGIFNPIGTSTPMVSCISNLHSFGFIDNGGNVWFGGESDNNSYITGNNIYEANHDSAGNVITGGFSMLATGWQAAEAPSGWFYGIRNSDSTLMACGDLQHGIRGIHGAAGATGVKWVPVPLPNGEKAKSIMGSWNLIILTWAGHVYTIGNSSTFQADLGWGSPSFAQSASGFSSTYDQPNELQFSSAPLAHIQMIAGGQDCNWAIDSSHNFYSWGQYGWRVGHSSTVGADQLSNPTLMNSFLTSYFNLSLIDTVVTDGACQHVLLTNGTIYGWGSTEQGTVGNGQQINYLTTTPPYFNGGANESAGASVVFHPVQIAPGKSNFVTLYNGIYYNYYDEAMDANGALIGWGRNKGCALQTKTVAADTAATQIEATYPDSWNRPDPTYLFNADTVTKVWRSNSPTCNTSCPAGPTTGAPCSNVSQICYTDHAHLSLTSSGLTIYANGSASTSTGFLPYMTFTVTAVPGGATYTRGVPDNPVTMGDTIQVSMPGTYTVKVVVFDPFWGGDSTTANITVGSQTGFYFSAAGTGTTCSISLPCPPSYVNTVYASAVGGDTLYFNRGDAFPIQIVANVSGSAGNPIVCKPYGSGNLPVLGGRTTLSGWTNVSGNVWKVNYTGPQPNILQQGDVILTQTTSPDLVNGWLTPTSMTTTTITDAAHAGMVTIGSKVMIRSSAFTIDTGIVSNVTGGVITFAPATYSGTGANGWKVMNITPYENGQYQDTIGQIRVYSVGSPSGTWTIPTVDTVLLSEGTYQEWDSLRFQGGNNSDIILAFQLIGNNVFNADSVTDAFDGFELRTEGNLTVKNTVMRHFTDNGVYKTNANNYNNSFINDIVYDAGMHPGLGKPGANDGYSGILAGDSGSIVLNCNIDSVGYLGVSNFGSGFSVDSNLIVNFMQTLEDGGAIYTWMPSAASFARERNIINNILINGGSSTSNLGVSLNPLVAGVYTDNYTQQVLVQGNGINNVDYGLYDHGPSILYYYNVVLNARAAQLVLGQVSTGPTITGVIAKYNIFGYSTPTASGAYSVNIFTNATNLPTFGSIDSNYYLVPIGMTTGLFTTSSIDAGTNRTIASWRTNTGYDSHTQYLNYAPLSFVYSLNGSSQPVYGIYRDVYQNQYNGSITIGAYLSAMLQRLSLPPLNSIQGGQIKFH